MQITSISIMFPLQLTLSATKQEAVGRGGVSGLSAGNLIRRLTQRYNVYVLHARYWSFSLNKYLQIFNS